MEASGTMRTDTPATAAEVSSRRCLEDDTRPPLLLEKCSRCRSVTKIVPDPAHVTVGFGPLLP